MTDLTPDFNRRFSGSDRLHQAGAAAHLKDYASVMVVGLGGVGGWAVEALARSAVGSLTLVDMDHIAESNLNRQIQADYNSLGQAKGEALRQRVLTFYPECEIGLVDDFISPDNADEILLNWLQAGKTKGRQPILLDCCDDARAKVAMATWAKKNRVPIAMAGSAGGKKDPWKIQPSDLRDTTCDPLLAKVRYQLRRAGTISRTDKAKLIAFFSDEPVKGNRSGGGGALNCAGYGSSVMVTATMGMQMAAWAVQQLLKGHHAEH